MPSLFTKIQIMLLPVLDEVRDSNQLYVTVQLAKRVAVVPSRHGAITVIDEFTDDRNRLQTGEPTQVNT